MAGKADVYLLPKQLDEQVSKLHLRALWEHEFMALVRTQVRALDFKRNQRSQLCLTASLRRTRTATSSACLATAARAHCSWTVPTDFICCNGAKVVYSAGFFVTVSLDSNEIAIFAR